MIRISGRNVDRHINVLVLAQRTMGQADHQTHAGPCNPRGLGGKRTRNRIEAKASSVSCIHRPIGAFGSPSGHIYIH